MVNKLHKNEKKNNPPYVMLEDDNINREIILA